MGETTKIQWCDHTFNPWMGCARVSPGCDSCYAATMGRRFGVQWGSNTERRFLTENNWSKPLAWNRKAARDGVRRRVFCGSMCDVFEGRRDLDSSREMLWELIVKTPHLDWLLLTKRPEKLFLLPPGVQPNIWLGVTAENQDQADKRIPLLLQTPAAVRFVSCEPLLGPVDLDKYLPGLDWVIIGGESGHRARSCDPQWIRSLAFQCRLNVSVFVKQLGGYPDKRANPNNWPPDLRVQEWPEVKP